MKVNLKDIVAQKMITIDKSKLDSSPINDQPEEDYEEKSRSRIEQDYKSWGLGYGDRLRITDNKGKLFDIILMSDNSIAIQEVILRPEFGKQEKFENWEKAMESLPEQYSFVKAIKV